MFFERAEYRSVLSDVLQEYFPMLQWLKKEVEAGDDILRLFERYKRNYRISETITLKNEDYSSYEIVDLKDEINYLRVCVKNICKVDLDNAEEIQNGAMEDAYPAERREWDRKRNYPTIPSNLILNIERSLIDSQSIRGKIQRINAENILRKKVISGEIYIYKTKPKRNLIVKGILVGLWLLGIIFLLISLIYNIVQVFIGGSIGEGSQAKFVISQLFFLPFFFFNIFFLHKKYKNENFKFTFCPKIFHANTISLFLFLLLAIVVSSKDNNSRIVPVSQMAIIASVVIAVIGTAIYLFSFLYFQPEKDNELINKYIEEYDLEESKETLPTEI